MVFVPDGLTEWPKAILTQPNDGAAQNELDRWLQTLTEFHATGFFYHISRVYPGGNEIAIAAKHRVVKAQEECDLPIPAGVVQFSKFQDDEFPLNLDTWQGANVIAFDTLTCILEGCVNFAKDLCAKYNHESKEWFEAFNEFLVMIWQQSGDRALYPSDIQQRMNNAVVISTSRMASGPGMRKSLNLQVEDFVLYQNAGIQPGFVDPALYAICGLRKGADGWLERAD